MLEVRITAAPELVQAINNLATALAGVKPLVNAVAPAVSPTQAPTTTVPPTGAPVAQAAPAQPTGTPAPVAPMTGPAAYPSNPPAPQDPAANPTQAGGFATTAQTGAPAAPKAGPTSAYPSNPPAIAPGAAYTAPAPAPTPAPAPQPQSAGVPLAPPPQYTIDQIMAAGATLMDAGRVDDLMNLLRSFGVQAVTDLKPEQMGAFATALRSLGARI